MQGTATARDHAEQGYLVVRNAFSRAEVEPLLAEAAEHVDWHAARTRDRLR